MKKYLVISGLVGGAIGGLIVVLFTSPVTAQPDKFGDIECTSLRVVDADGKTWMILRDDILEAILLEDMDTDNIRVSISGTGFVVSDKDGESRVLLGISEHGGSVAVEGRGKGMALMGINEHGNGAVSTWDKNGNLQQP